MPNIKYGFNIRPHTSDTVYQDKLKKIEKLSGLKLPGVKPIIWKDYIGYTLITNYYLNQLSFVKYNCNGWPLINKVFDVEI